MGESISVEGRVAARMKNGEFCYLDLNMAAVNLGKQRGIV